MTLRTGTIVVYSSADGVGGWDPVLPADVPAFVKDKETMGYLVAHPESCVKAGGALWYRAEQVEAGVILPAERRVRIVIPKVPTVS